MRKLFTLFALMLCVLGVNAKVIIDSKIVFSEVTEFKDYLYNSEEAKKRLSIVNGCLHFSSSEATTNNWDCQFSPLDAVQNMEVGITYTLKLKIKGSPSGSLAAHLGGTDNYSAINVTPDWSEQTISYECKDVKGPYGTNNKLNIQCGSFIGEWDIEYIEISHEGKEEKPVTWEVTSVNGNAEGEYGDVPCVITKVYKDVDEAGKEVFRSAAIESDPKDASNKVFVCHAPAVDPVLVWDSEGEQWGQKHNAGDPKPDNAWANQMWIQFPRAMKEGEQVKVSFKYKASTNINVETQSHRSPGDYIGGGTMGTLSFTTDWQTKEQIITCDKDQQTIAMNLGSERYDEAVDFYLDDVNISEMVLQKGYFVCGSTNVTLASAYDPDDAVELKWDEKEKFYIGTIGDKNNESTWVSGIMVSTVYGNTKAFKTNTVKCVIKNYSDESFYKFEDASNAIIKLPARGAWTIYLDGEKREMNFVQEAGDEIKAPVKIVANPTKVVVEATEREYLQDEAPEGYEFNKNDEGNDIVGQPWDNQFCIKANRPLQAGETMVVSFKYKAKNPAKVTTQIGGEGLGAWMAGEALGDIEFTAEEKEFTKTFDSTDGMQTITFNMAVIKEANTYEIYDIIWMLEDETESLIDMESSKNLNVKVAAGGFVEVGAEETGIAEVAAAKKAVPTITVNLAGQRVSKDYKGIVIKGGKAVLNK